MRTLVWKHRTGGGSSSLRGEALRVRRSLEAILEDVVLGDLVAFRKEPIEAENEMIVPTEEVGYTLYDAGGVDSGGGR